MSTGQQPPATFREALAPAALRDALVLRRPVFANPWDSTEGMFGCFAAVSLFNPLLLWCGGKLMGAIFGFSSHWRIGVFMVASLVGAAGLDCRMHAEHPGLAGPEDPRLAGHA